MILFENVTKKYRGTAKPALDGIDLQVDRGEFVFIVGASGSGKSSCLRLILREDQPSSGKIHVLGQDLSKISSRKVPYFRRNLGTVFQDFRLLTNKTVYDNVAFSLQVIGKSRGFIQEAVPDTLEMVGLANKAKRFPHELSGGEQQRVAIARAIVNKPAILLADEPTGNLDPATSLGIMQLLRAINAAGTTVVMATHEATFVDIMQQRVVELSQGVIVRDEQGGGYGETASIPVADLSAEGVRVLRTTEAVVRAALEPEELARANAEAAAGAAAVEDGAGSAAAVAAATTEARVVSAAAAAAAGAAAAAVTEAAADPGSGAEAAGSTDPAADATPEASVYEEPRPFGEHDPAIDGDDWDDTVRADGGPHAKRIPGFLDPGRPMDPVQMSETGSLAEHLGLDRNDDEQTDVGPVR
ncbi:cell division ATP-binding protein FtsE [Leucobacter chromiireducens]|uniref:Cell division ATP-binding protein FtsE n=1 Tax=Leucobacter chromiireducens subsp. solipictus TaxID=398235 RepID=A0ABS1SCH1_9MICO|nr:cell division ATP-binding protein FtsE [Leucobacter chromiireducens]MBL3678240.1 cell division ATP-binding protein FtsE [Leucobacter chromiireducens subsp. solipictus]